MSKYLVNKFLFTIDRDPGLVERYRADPAGTVTWWETERANLLLSCIPGEASTWLAFTDQTPHAAVSGQCALEQTFYVPVDALAEPASSPLRILERLWGAPLV